MTLGNSDRQEVPWSILLWLNIKGLCTIKQEHEKRITVMSYNLKEGRQIHPHYDHHFLWKHHIHESTTNG